MMTKAILGKVVHLRVSEAEFAALQAFSAKAGSSISEVLRRLSRQATGLEQGVGWDGGSSIAAYIGELMSARTALEAVARDLRGRDEPHFDALIEAMSRLARLVSDHAMAMQGMSDTSRLPAPEVGAGDV